LRQLPFRPTTAFSSSTNTIRSYDPQYLGIQRSDKVVFIQITLSAGRKPGQKRALYRRIVELLGKSPGVRPEDVVINLVEVAWEDWSFGLGEAQYTKD
jgi:4-oxalocrotonate tautomerase